MAEATGRKRPDGTARLAFVGDIMLGGGVDARFGEGKAPEAFWGDLLPEFRSADAVIGNLESPITASTKRWHRWKAHYFRARPEAIAILRAANVCCVSLANNHMLDFAEAGLRDTIRHLDQAGIAHAGAGEGLAAAAEPAVFRAGGLAIGFASITNTLRAFAAGPEKAGTCYVPIGPSRAEAAFLATLVSQLRLRGAELLILGVHWGPNFRAWPPSRYRAFARMAIELGFNIIHGHSAHILQALEFHRGGLILYDTGDILDDYTPFPIVRLDRSCVFNVEIAGGRPQAVRLMPVTLARAEVNHAVGAEAQAIRATMMRRCRGYAVELAAAGDGLVAKAPAHEAAGAPRADSASSMANSRNR